MPVITDKQFDQELRALGLVRGSRDYREYERGKQYIREIAPASDDADEYDRLIEKLIEFLNL